MAKCLLNLKKKKKKSKTGNIFPKQLGIVVFFADVTQYGVNGGGLFSAADFGTYASIYNSRAARMGST